MKKVILVSLFVSLIAINKGTAQHINPSNVRISLLTAAQGEDVYLAFGHNAIRVKIDSLGYDAVYNYGTFDFNQPNFYVNLARGRMNYHLARSSYNDFMAEYMYENRAMREQVFALDSAQTMFMLQFLGNNYKPENRYYLYHFFLDNCATRIRDLMLQTYKGIELPTAKENLTYRELVYLCTQQHPWGRFGIDIGLGLPTDQKTDTYEQMFLPDYIYTAFSQALYHGRPIVREAKDIFVPDRPAIQPPGPFTPMVVCCLVLALALLFFYVRKGSKAFDFVLFFTVGVVGLLIIFLWFFTDHTNTRNNLNIIWALPSHIIMAFVLLPKRRSKAKRIYFLATAVTAMLLLVSWAFLPQKLNVALIPLVLAIALRSFRIFRINL